MIDLLVEPAVHQDTLDVQQLGNNAVAPAVVAVAAVVGLAVDLAYHNLVVVAFRSSFPDYQEIAFFVDLVDKQIYAGDSLLAIEIAVVFEVPIVDDRNPFRQPDMGQPVVQLVHPIHLNLIILSRHVDPLSTYYLLLFDKMDIEVAAVAADVELDAGHMLPVVPLVWVEPPHHIDNMHLY